MNHFVLEQFTDQQHEQFMEQGYLRLGHLLTAAELSALQQRIDDIMLGKMAYPTMYFQLDGKTGDYSGLGPDSPGHSGSGGQP